MQKHQFNQLVENRFEDCRNTLVEKSKEYARNDRLSNFKKAAKYNDETPERALWGILKKQIVSISDFIDDLDDGYCMPRSKWEEKIKDIINYIILLEGLMIERTSTTDVPAEHGHKIRQNWLAKKIKEQEGNNLSSKINWDDYYYPK